MKSFLCGIGLLISVTVCAQPLEGSWKGYYVEDTHKRQGKDKQFLTLEFIRVADSGFRVYSFTRLAEFEAKCELSLVIAQPDSIFLEEVKLVNPRKRESPCFQRMKLKLLRTENGPGIAMEGTWDSANPECGFGRMYFRKQ